MHFSEKRTLHQCTVKSQKTVPNHKNTTWCFSKILAAELQKTLMGMPSNKAKQSQHGAMEVGEGTRVSSISPSAPLFPKAVAKIDYKDSSHLEAQSTK